MLSCTENRNRCVQPISSIFVEMHVNFGLKHQCVNSTMMSIELREYEYVRQHGILMGKLFVTHSRQPSRLRSFIHSNDINVSESI